MATLDSKPLNETAAADLSAKQWRFGKRTSSGINVCSVAGEAADGIIGGGFPKAAAAGKGIDLYMERAMKVETGGTFGVAAELTTDANGKAIAAGAGDHVNAIATEACTAAGQIVGCTPPFTRSAGAANVADDAAGPGVPVIFTKTIDDAASDTYDVTITDKVEIIDVVVQKISNDAGSNANTVQIKNGTDAISDAISINGKSDKAIVRATTIDDAHSTIAAGGTLSVAITKAGGDAAVKVFIYGVKRA